MRVEQTGVFISDDWVVSIYGKKAIQCVSAMLVLMELIDRKLGASVEVKLSGLQNGKDEPLESAVRGDERRDSLIGVIKWGTTILVSVGLGALIQWLVCKGVLP